MANPFDFPGSSTEFNVRRIQASESFNKQLLDECKDEQERKKLKEQIERYKKLVGSVQEKINEIDSLLKQFFESIEQNKGRSVFKWSISNDSDIALVETFLKRDGIPTPRAAVHAMANTQNTTIVSYTVIGTPPTGVPPPTP